MFTDMSPYQAATLCLPTTEPLSRVAVVIAVVSPISFSIDTPKVLAALPAFVILRAIFCDEMAKLLSHFCYFQILIESY
jgi:hypothetical protein